MSDELNLEIILKAINETGSPFSELSESIKSLQSSVEGLSKTMSDNFQSMTNAANTLSSDMSKDMSNASKSIAEFEKTASSDLAGASQNMDSLRTNMNKGIDQIGGLIAIQMLGQSMEHLGKQGEKLFDFAIDQGADFQQTMKNVQTVVAVNSDGQGDWNSKLKDSVGITDQLQQKALDLGSRGAQSANEIGTAMDAMLRGGVDPAAVLNGAAQAAQNVAIVTGDKLSDSADLMTNTYHEFRSEFEKNGKSIQQNMTDSGNVISGVLLSAKISSTEFGDTFKYVAPLAAQMGSSLLDTATATAVLARNGIDGSQAGTNLKRVFTSLLAPTKEGTKALTELGIIQNGHNQMVDESTGKLKSLTEMQAILSKSTEGLTEVKKAQIEKELFGQYALTGSLVLINQNTSEYGKLKAKIGNVDAEQAAINMLDTFSGHMKQLQAHVQTTAKEFGLAFIPVLEKLLPIGQKILDWLQNLTPANKELLMGLLAVGSGLAILGGALATFAISAKFAGEGMKALQSIFMVQAEGEAAISIFKKFAMAVREVGIAEAFMDLMNPVGWIVLAVAAVIALAVVIIQHWGPIKDFLIKSWELISSTAVKVWNGIVAFFKKWGLDIIAVFLGPVGIIAKLIFDNWDAIKKFTITIWNDITGFIKTTWTGFTTWLKTTTSALVSGIVGVWNGFISSIINLWHGFTTMIKVAVQATMQGIVNAFSWMYNHNYYFKALVDFIVNAWNTISKKTTEVWNAIKAFITSAFSAISSFVTKTWTDITKFLTDTWNSISKTATTVWNAISDFFTSLWEGISKVAKKVWNAIKLYYETIWNGLVKVAKEVWQPISDFFSSLWNGIDKGITKVWNGIKTFLSSLWKGIISDATGIFNSLGSYFSDLGQQAFQWGANLVTMIANGITDAAHKVADAANAVVGKIKGFLGFHSPAKEGPGKDADTWMPNLFKMMTEQIHQSIPNMQAALQVAFNPSMTGVTNMSAVTNMAPVMAGGGSSPIYNITVHASGNIATSEEHLADIVSKGFLNKMKGQNKIG